MASGIAASRSIRSNRNGLQDLRFDHFPWERRNLMILFLFELDMMLRRPLRWEQEDRLGVDIFARTIGAQQRQPGIEAPRGIGIEPAPAIDHDQPVDPLRCVQRQVQPTHPADRMAEDRGLLDAERVHQQADIVADAPRCAA